MKPRALIIFFALIMSGQLQAQTLVIKVSNLKTGNGVLRIGLFTSDENFKEGTPLYYRTYQKTDLSNGELSINCTDIAPGHYGIAILDDENANDKTDFGLILPSEGFGFSGFIQRGLIIPKFDDFDFTFDGSILQIGVYMKYL